MLDFLLPNRVISRKDSHYVVLGWIGIALIAWFFSPFVFLPKPGEVLDAVQDLWKVNNVGVELLTSFMLNVETIFIATILSLILSYLNTINLFKPVIAITGKLRFLSMVGLPFVFELMTSNGHQLKVSLLVFCVTVFFVTGMCDVIASIPQEKYDLAKTLKMNEWRSLWEVVVLGCADQAFDVMRQNAAIGFFMITMVESMERSEGGIGTVLLNQDHHFNMAAVMAIQLMILGVGLTQDWFIGFMKNNMFCTYAKLRIKR